ncbi:hypothetical protein SRABI84_01851 [Peribacillus simplex]|nr:hypothetical protein SRABI84_01851 [Peribacillus simplex]
MKIRDLDFDYGQQLFKLQKEAYKVEAEMIGLPIYLLYWKHMNNSFIVMKRFYAI